MRRLGNLMTPRALEREGWKGTTAALGVVYPCFYHSNSEISSRLREKNRRRVCSAAPRLARETEGRRGLEVFPAAQ